MTCDPLDVVNRCPGGLLCGTDKFCHPDGESSMACLFELNDAARPPDAAFFDARPVDAAPNDAFTMCPGGVWQADFDTDPTLPSPHFWTGKLFDFTTDVTNASWQPKVGMESLATAPNGSFQNITVFQARVTVQMLDAYRVDLHLVAGGDKSVDVDVAITRGSANQLYTVNVTGDTTKTQGGVMSVNPHLMIGKLDYPGHTFKLFIDDASEGPAVTLTFSTNSTGSAAQAFTVTADTNTIVDDLGVCAM